MIFAPLFAVINLLPDNDTLNGVVDTLVEQEVIEADVADIIKSELTAREGFVIKAYNIIGISGAGKLYLSSVSKFEHGAHKPDIPSELDPVFSAAQVLVEAGLIKAIGDTENPNALLSLFADKAMVAKTKEKAAKAVGDVAKAQKYKNVANASANAVNKAGKAMGAASKTMKGLKKSLNAAGRAGMGKGALIGGALMGGAALANNIAKNKNK